MPVSQDSSQLLKAHLTTLVGEIAVTVGTDTDSFQYNVCGHHFAQMHHYAAHRCTLADQLPKTVVATASSLAIPQSLYIAPLLFKDTDGIKHTCGDSA